MLIKYPQKGFKIYVVYIIQCYVKYSYYKIRKIIKCALIMKNGYVHL